MASLIKRHSKLCKGHPGKAEKDGPKQEDCTCQPTYFIQTPDGKESIGKIARKEAQRQLAETAGKVATGTHQPLKNITFNDWAVEWFNGLRNPGDSTLHGYASTLEYARAAFGQKLVRNLTANDLDRLLSMMGTVRHSRYCEKFAGEPFNDETTGDGCSCTPKALSGSTQAKHLRVLSACLNAAVQRRYAAENPVKTLTRGERPKAKKNEAAYYENDELPKLFAEFRDFDKPLFEAALKTGMRLGELLALTWGDVNLTEQTIRVTKSYTAGFGVTDPKTEAGKRTVDIENGTVKLFGDLLKELGEDFPPDNALVFPNTAGGYRDANWIRHQLFRAMERAGVPRVGSTGKARVFHSFRHTFAKLAMENGAQLGWLQRHMGHESLAITNGIYGHFGAAARKAEVGKMEGAFNV